MSIAVWRKPVSKFGEMISCQGSDDPGPISHDNFEFRWASLESSSSNSDGF